MPSLEAPSVISPKHSAPESVALDQVYPGVWALRLGTPEKITPVSVRGSAPLPPSEEERAEARQPPFSPAQIKFRAHARGCTVTLPFDADEGVFGLGLQLKSHLQSGKKKHLRVNADPVADTGDSHAPVPFYASTRGYAVLADTARYASVYVGTHANVGDIERRVHQKWNAPSLAVEELYRGQSFGNEVVIDIPAARGVTLYFFAGPALGDAIARYNRFSGGGCLPPLWALGNWYRACSQHDAARIAGFVETFDQDALPISVVGLEPGWQKRFYPNSFTWDAARFPDPAGFIADLHRRGLRVNLWENAFVHPEAPFADAIRPYCGDQLSTDGLAPDFLHPRAAEIFARHHDGLVDQGVDGFKLDECDNGDFVPFAWSFPEHTQFPSGADGEQMHCLYGVHYQQTLAKVFAKRGLRQFDLVRSSGALAAPLPYVLYSDLYGHRDFIRGTVTAGYSGLLWTPELRDASSLEDLVRRAQTVVLSPMSLINGWYCPLPPWWQWDKKLNEAGKLMPEKETATSLIRAALELRVRLIPVLYAAYAHYRRTGVPPVRGLPFDHPSDKRTWTCDRSFLVGRDLIAAPLMAGETSLDVYLPAGRWRDFHTGRMFEGGRVHTLKELTIADIPLFVRDGAVLPLVANPSRWRADAGAHPVEAHVYAEDSAEGGLYEDDGLTPEAEQPASRWTRLRWTRAGGLQTSVLRARGQAPSLFPLGGFKIIAR